MTPQNTINRRLASIRRFSTFLSSKYGLNSDLQEAKNQTKGTSSPNNLLQNNDDDSLPTIKKILDHFKVFLVKEKKTHSTIKNYVSDLNHFFAWSANETPFLDQNLENILSESHLNTYVTYLKLSHTSTSVINRRQSSIKQFTKYCFLQKYIPTNPFEYKHETPRLLPLSWFERFSSSKNKHGQESSKSRLGIWYQKYNSLPFTPYLHLAILVLATSAMVIFGYNQIIKQALPSSAALPTIPRRQLSFQGRLTDSSGTPITTSVNVTFKLWNDLTAGTQLYTSGTCPIIPDPNGIFNTLIGNGTCGAEIANTVFTENRDVYLEVIVGAETLTPRQQIATVGYALNSETLQGYPASASATVNTVPIVDNNGDINIAASSPTINSTSGTFTLNGQALTLTTTANSGGDIILQPDALGGGQIQMLGGTTNTDFLRIENANLTSGALISGYVGNNTATGRLLSLTAGSTETDRFYVAANGQTAINTSATLVNAALIANQNGTGDLFTASASGVTKFTIANNGNITATGTLTGLTGLTVSSGTVSLPNGEINNAEISELDWTKLQNYPSACPAGEAIQAVGDTLTCVSISAASGNLWQLNSGALTPANITNSINIGATATASALVHLAGTTGDNSFINTGNFGIGLTNPAYKLDVTGDINLTGALRDNGSAGTPGQILSTTGTGVEWINSPTSSGAGPWNWNTGVIFPFSITDAVNLGNAATASATVHLAGTTGDNSFINTGNFGIGLTNPAYKLDVTGDINLTGALRDNGSAGNAGDILSSTGTGVQWIAPSTFSGANQGWTWNTGVLYPTSITDAVNLGNAATASATVHLAGTAGDNSFINTGNFGIGLTNPGSKLTVVGSVTTSGGNVSLNDSSNFTTNINTGTSTGAVTIGGGSNTVAVNSTSWDISTLGAASGFTGIASSGDIDFSSLSAGGLVKAAVTTGRLSIASGGTDYEFPLTFSNGLTRTVNAVKLGGTLTANTDIPLGGFNMAFSGTGNFGIGLTNPAYKLDVTGDINLTGALRDNGSAGNAGDILSSTGTGVQWIAPSTFSGANQGWTWNTGVLYPTSITDAVNLGNAATASATVHLAGTAGDNSFINTGNFGIGLTNPAYKLDVVGDVNTTGSYLVNGVPLTSSNWQRTSGSLAPLNITDSVNIGAVATASALVHLAGTTGDNSFINTGNFGIGLTNPAYKLDVTGDINLTGALRDNGSAGNAGDILSSTGTGVQWIAPSTFSGANQGWTWNTGVLYPTSITDAVNLGNAATASATVHLAGTAGDNSFINTGNFGIGLTNPATALDVVGVGQFSTGLTLTSGALNLTSTSGALAITGLGASTISTTANNLTLSTVTSGTLALTSAGALNLSAGAASTWTLANVVNSLNFDSNTLTIDALNNRIGIGLTNPADKLQIAGNILPTVAAGPTPLYNLGSGSYPWLGAYLASIYDTSGVEAISVTNHELTQGDWFIPLGGLRINGSSPVPAGYSLWVDGNASVSGTLSTGGQLTVGNGAGKIDVGTVDPPYTINGTKYATYMASMIGIKEETVGKVATMTENYIEGLGYRTLIKFDQQEIGSDLWLFNKTTNIQSNIDKLSVLLTPEGQAKAWYEVDKTNKILAIYSSTPTNITYRLTAPRFDSYKWSNLRTSASVGHLINDSRVYDDTNGIFANPVTSPELIQKVDGTYALKINSVENKEVASFMKSIIANLQAGAAVIANLVTDNLETSNLTVKTKLISPLADIDQLKTIDATISGTLYADNIKSETVDNLRTEINLLDKKYSTASGILADLEARYSTYSSLFGATSSAIISGDPLALSPLAKTTPIIPSDLALNSLNVHTLITNDMLANGAIFTQSISAFDTDLYIQPTGDKLVYISNKLMILDPDGKVVVNGDLLVTGNLLSKSLDTQTATVSGTLAVGSSTIATESARFTELTTDGLIIASGNNSSSGSGSTQTNTNATIGTGTITANTTEINILNTKITDTTLIYVTPTSDTGGEVLYVKSKQSGVGFTIAIAKKSTADISFNFWLVETK